MVRSKTTPKVSSAETVNSKYLIWLPANRELIMTYITDMSKSMYFNHILFVHEYCIPLTPHNIKYLNKIKVLEIFIYVGLLDFLYGFCCVMV